MNPETILIVIRMFVVFVLLTLHTFWVVSTFRPFDQIKAWLSLTSYVCMLVVYAVIVDFTLR